MEKREKKGSDARAALPGKGFGMRTFFLKSPFAALRRRSHHGSGLQAAAGGLSRGEMQTKGASSPGHFRAMAPKREASAAPPRPHVAASPSAPRAEDDYVDFMRGKRQSKYIPFEEYDRARFSAPVEDSFYPGSDAHKKGPGAKAPALPLSQRSDESLEFL